MSLVGTEDIIKEVSRELGVSKIKTKAILDYSIAKLKTLMEDKSIFNIYIHDLGRIYQKLSNLGLEIFITERKINSGRYPDKKVESLKEELALLKTKLEEMQVFSKTEKGKFTSQGKYHRNRERIISRRFNKGMSLIELEEYQNNEEEI